MFDIHIPTASEAHQCLTGENGLDGAGQISGPGTITFTVPTGTSTTAGTSIVVGNKTDTDQNHRVTMNADTVGDYKVVVSYKGRNAAAL